MTTNSREAAEALAQAIFSAAKSVDFGDCLSDEEEREWQAARIAYDERRGPEFPNGEFPN